MPTTTVELVKLSAINSIADNLAALTEADRVQTGLDAAATAADAIATAADRVQTGLDAAATAADAIATAADRVQTGLDAAATAADAIATAADRVQTGLDAAATAADAIATAADRVQTGLDAISADNSATLALAANEAAEAAASASGNVLFYDTKAAANSALSGLSEGQIVEVMLDESVSSLRTRYRKTSGAYVFKVIIGEAKLATVAALMAIPYSSALTTAITLGALAAGDGGGGFWRWNAASTATHNVGTIINPTGNAGAGRWERVYDGAVNVLWFGAYRDNSNAAATTAAIQAAINWAIHRPDTGYSYEEVYLPGGQYFINDTLQLGYGTGLASVHLRGDGPRYRNGGTFSGTSIYTQTMDRPAIAVSGARHTTIRDIQIMGTNTQWCEESLVTSIAGLAYSRTGTTVTVTQNGHSWVSGYVLYISGSADFTATSYTITVVDENTWQFTTTASGAATGTLTAIPDITVSANWLRKAILDAVTPGTNAGTYETTRGRYAPYAGIAVDPYSVTPAPAYAYPGASYNKGKSSFVVMENVKITGFEVGFVAQPGGGDGNGDFMKFSHCTIECCKYGVSVGHTQARLTSFQDGIIATCHTAFTTRTHGMQLGKPHFIVTGTELTTLIRVGLISNTSYGSVITFRGCYGEFIYRIGDFGDGGVTGVSPVLFDTCEFEFGMWNYYGIPNDAIKSANVPVTFRNCTLTTQASTVYIIHLNGTAITLDNCLIKRYDNTASAASRRQAINGTCGVFIPSGLDISGDVPLQYAAPVVRVQHRAFNLNTGAYQPTDGYYDSTEPAKYCRDRCEPIYSRSVPHQPNVKPERGVYYPYALGSSVTRSGRTVTFTRVEANYNIHLFRQRGGEVGDILYETQTETIFIVRSCVVDGSYVKIIAEAQNNTDRAGNWIASVAYTGTLIGFNCRRYMLWRPTEYSSTEGNAVLSDVQCSDGDKSYLTSTYRGVQVDDYIYSPTSRLFTVEGGAKVNAVDAVAGTITLSHNALYTKTKELLGWFMRPGLVDEV